jgi:hypothetical protein
MFRSITFIKIIHTAIFMVMNVLLAILLRNIFEARDLCIFDHEW